VSHHEIKKPEDIVIPSSSFVAKLPMLGGILAVAGLGATLGSAFGEHKARAMFSYLWAFESALAIVLGGLGMLLIDHSVRTGWNVVLRRQMETLVGSLPLFVLLWIPIGFIGFHELFPWSHETDAILEKKRWFLTSGFWYFRAVIYFVTWCALGVFLHRSSLKQDTMEDAAAREKVVHLTRKISAAGIILYALTMSGGAIDWMMSLQPHWYSTIFGVYIFAGALITSHAVLADNDPAYELSYLVHYFVDDILNVEWDDQWRGDVVEGTVEAPTLVMIKDQKVEGSEFITTSEGTVALFATDDPAITEVRFVEHLDALMASEGDVIDGTQSNYDRMLAAVHGQPLPSCLR
jgi:hypothetical protein